MMTFSLRPTSCPLAGDGGLGEDAGGLLEGGGGQPAIGAQRGAGDAQQNGVGRGGFAAFGQDLGVGVFVAESVHELIGHEVGIAGGIDSHAVAASGGR